VLDTRNDYSFGYSWSNSAANNGGRTAAKLCSDHAGWYFRTEASFLQAYIDGAYWQP